MVDSRLSSGRSVSLLCDPDPPERILSTAMKTHVRQNVKNQYNSLNPRIRRNSGHLDTLGEEEDSAGFDE